MSQIQTAKSQISRYGFKGAASITQVSTVEDLDNLSIVETDDVPILLLAYVGSFPSGRIDGKMIFANDRRVLAVPDIDWDGTINEESKITIDSIIYSIENFAPKKVNGTLAYVEIQCRG